MDSSQDDQFSSSKMSLKVPENKRSTKIYMKRSRNKDSKLNLVKNVSLVAEETEESSSSPNSKLKNI
jgi:hypothetical protein